MLRMHLIVSLPQSLIPNLMMVTRNLQNILRVVQTSGNLKKVGPSQKRIAKTKVKIGMNWKQKLPVMIRKSVVTVMI